MEGPSQIIVIDREQIENSGFNEVGQILRESAASPFGSSLDRANLRGLGSARTLVLINGQRVPGSGDTYSPGTDINVVPLAAVERIEVLNDGASSMYGSDALAGVVNIITRKDLTDSVFATKIDIPSQPGGANARSSVAYGTNWDKSSLLASVQVSASTGVKATDRNYLVDINDDFIFSSNYVDDGGNIQPAPGCTEFDNAGRCAEKLAGEAVTEPGYNIATFINYKTEFSGLEFFTDFILRYGLSNSRQFEATLSDPTSSGLSFEAGEAPAAWTASLPGYNAANPTVVFHRITELDKRGTEVAQISTGLVTGLGGYFGGSDWEWKATNNIHNFLTDEKNTNYALRAPVKAAIEAGTYDPFGAAGDTTGFTHDPFSRAYYIINTTDFVTNGELGEALGFVWSGAAGAFFQFSEYKDERDQPTLNGDVMGLRGVTGGGNRAVGALFAEFQGILGKSLELQFAARHDQYNDFGGTTNPKFAFRYKPFNLISFRGSVASGFQAPSLQDSYGPKITGFVRVVDRKQCDAVGNDPNNEFCKVNPYNAEQGSNPDLKEETSLAYSIGTIIQPTDNLSISADYNKIKIDDVVASDLSGLLEIDAMNVDVSKYGAVIERNPVTQRIEFISAPLRNFANEEIDMINISLKWHEKFSFGNLSANVEHVQTFNYYQRSYAELGKNDIVGEAGVPAWRNFIVLGYETKDSVWATSLTARTTSVVEKVDPAQGNVPQYTEADFQVNYKSPFGKFQIGFINVFDTQPEFDDSLSSKIDSTLYNRFRRSYVAYETTF